MANSNTTSVMSTNAFTGLYSTNDIWRGDNSTRCLTDDLDAMDVIHAALPNTYASKDHTHSGYLSSSGGTVSGDLTLSTGKKLSLNNIYININGDGTGIIYGRLPNSSSYIETFQPCNENGNTVIGYGNYLRNGGNTNIYGKSVNIYAKNTDGSNTGAGVLIARNTNNHMLINYAAQADKNSSTYIYGDGVHVRSNDDDFTVDNIQLAHTDITTITSLSNGWAIYGSTTTPTVRRYGKIVSLTGTIKNTSAITLNSSHVEAFTIPSGYRPSQEIVVVCQGSGANKYMMQIGTNGSCRIGRYGTTSFGEAPANSWFPFHITWVME